MSKENSSSDQNKHKNRSPFRDTSRSIIGNRDSGENKSVPNNITSHMDSPVKKPSRGGDKKK